MGRLQYATNKKKETLLSNVKRLVSEHIIVIPRDTTTTLEPTRYPCQKLQRD